MTINAYINFPGNCKEAMTFYKECMAADLVIQIIGESAIAAQCPSAMQDKVLHATLIKGDLLLMGSDMSGPGGIVAGNNMALSLNCTGEEEINDLFEKLGAGGSIIDPLSVKFWGAMFGVVDDKFGIRWMLNYDKNSK